jgi:hypothetical protein
MPGGLQEHDLKGLREFRACRLSRAVAVLGVLLTFAAGDLAYAQPNTRLLVSTGWGVPDHQGFVFGPFSNLAMNAGKDIVFLSVMRGAKRDLRAVVRSTGVTFDVVAFEGLRSPVSRATYESFSAPSLNNAGVLAFTATLRDGVPSSAVIRWESGVAQVVATSGGGVPGSPDATFLEFSAPIINSVGNVLFAARTGESKPGTGLFLWTPQGIRPVSLPADLHLTPNDLLVPAFASRGEAVFVLRGAPLEVVTEQFFRAVAIKSFQDLMPPPAPPETVEVLPARPDERPVKMLLVVMEGDAVGVAALEGDPSQPVLARQPPGIAISELGRIEGQTTGPRGNIIFAAANGGEERDLAFYCYCDGQVDRLTSPEEFWQVTVPAQGKPILSLAGDGLRAVSFIAPNGESGDSVGIYVTSLP